MTTTYTWDTYKKAMNQQSFDEDMISTPIMLSILQDILDMVPKESVQSRHALQIIQSWTQEPGLVELADLIDTFKSLLEDDKYIAATKRWTLSALGMYPADNTTSPYNDQFYAKMMSKFAASSGGGGQ